MRNKGLSTTEQDAVLAGSPDRTALLYRLTDRLYRAKTMADAYDAALDAITEGMDCCRASILLFDTHNVMRFVNWRGLSERYRSTLEGHTPWRRGQRDAVPIFIEDIDLTSESEVVKSTIRAEGIRALAFVPLEADGGVIGKFMTYYEESRLFTEEEQALALTIARQVSFSHEKYASEQARKKAERDLRESEERFRAMSELAPVMTWLSNEHGACLHLNRALRTFWGVSESAIGGFDWRLSMHPEDAPEIGRRIMEAVATKSAVRVKGRYRNAAGEFRMLETVAEPRISGDGEFLGLVGVNIDVTDRDQAEAHRDLLLAELNHRVKNTIAVVQGLANQTFKSDSNLALAKQAFDGRLAAFARAHDLLAKGTGEQASLVTLVSDAVRSPNSGAERVRISGPELLLSSRHATAVAMSLHELFTNAMKYGALSAERGTIAVNWNVGHRELQLTWCERGGPPVQAPSRRGFGSKLLERALADVEGKVNQTFEREGLVCCITMPLPYLEE